MSARSAAADAAAVVGRAALAARGAGRDDVAGAPALCRFFAGSLRSYTYPQTTPQNVRALSMRRGDGVKVFAVWRMRRRR